MLAAIPNGEASRIIEHEKAGIVVPAEDPPALVFAVRQLRDDKTRQEYAARSLAAAPVYSRERQAENVLRVLDKVV